MIDRPAATEYSDYHARHIQLVSEDDLFAAMEAQATQTRRAFLAYSAQPDLTYSPGKWTVRQMLGHLSDTERVFGSRLLWIARADPAVQPPQHLPSFEHDDWVEAADFSRYALPELLGEFETVRKGHLSLLRHLPPEAWERQGNINGNFFSVRALAFILLGHERAHLQVLRERYTAHA